jgi:predicted ArsR family transcriptional regulator
MKKTTRNRIIEHIRVKKVVSAGELARALNITASDARHHLSSLEDEGVVIMVYTQKQGRGRPTQLFRLTRDLNRHNLESLTVAMMSVWLDGQEENQRETAYRKIANFISEGLKPSALNLPQRLVNAIRCLNEMRYQARWEAHAEGPRILVHQCPYAPISTDFPAICRVDAYIIGNLLGEPVSLISSEGNYLLGNRKCIFKIDSKAQAPDIPLTTK